MRTSQPACWLLLCPGRPGRRRRRLQARGPARRSGSQRQFRAVAEVV